MITRRTEDGAEKCSLRLFLLEECFASSESATIAYFKILMMWNILALTFAIMYRGCNANGSEAFLRSKIRREYPESGKCAASTLEARAEVV